MVRRLHLACLLGMALGEEGAGGLGSCPFSGVDGGAVLGPLASVAGANVFEGPVRPWGNTLSCRPPVSSGITFSL